MTLEQIIAIEQIKQLKARYFRCLDTKRWDELEQVFASDASLTVDLSEQPKPAAVGRREVAAFIRSHTEHAITVHHGHMPEIDILSPTTARATWSMEDIVETKDRTAKGYGHYHETYRVEDGAWRIASLRLTRLRVFVSTRE